MKRGAPDPIRVLVTGATHNTGLAMIRALAAGGARVIGSDDRALPLGLHSRFSTPYRVYPVAQREGPFVERMLELVREDRPDVLLASGTAACFALARQRARFERLTALNLPDPESFEEAEDSLRMLRACRELGIPHPAILEETEAAARLEDEARPGTDPLLVVKPRRDVGGARGVFYVRDRAELRAALEACRRFGTPFIQEFVPGPPENMHTVLALYDRNSRLAAAFTIRKLRQWPTGGGNTAIGISTCEPQLVSQVQPLFERWRWRGAAEVELKHDAVRGETRVIEVNPRFSGYAGFPVVCGLNLPYLACRVALGEEVVLPYPSYVVGRKYLNTHLLARSLWAELRQRRDVTGVLGRLLRQLEGGARPNSHAPSDPLPRVGKLLAELLDAMAPAGSPRLERRREREAGEDRSG